MALASLRFQRNAQDYEETRQGNDCFRWRCRLRFTSGNFVFRSRSRYARQKSFLHWTAKVVHASRGEALSCAMEIGLAKLMEANGLDLLVQKVQERLFSAANSGSS